MQSSAKKTNTYLYLQKKICMKRIRLSVLTLLMCFSVSLWGQSSKKIEINQPHPRLLLLKGEEELIRSKIQANEFLLKTHNYILKRSETFITEPALERVLTGKRLLSVSRKALERIYYLSYAWRMTGDVRFAARAEKEMLNVSAFINWNPTHFLDVAEMTLALSVGYDWLFSYLSESTKEIVRHAIVSKGLNESMPETAGDESHYSWLKKVNNWNQVCNTGMAFGAIATYEQNPELSKKIIARSITLVRDKGMPEYLPDGNYPEGYTYWSYETGFNLMLIDALEKCLGSSFGMTNNRGFMATPEYILQMTTQKLGCFAYSDCGSDHLGMSFPMFWFASKQKNPDLLWGELQKYNYMISNNQEDEVFNVRYLPSLMIWASADALKNPQPPQKRLYVGQGQTPIAILRNHWGGNDELFVGLKGGKCTTNHAHMDVGSFVMYRGVNQWVKDMGMQEYNSLEKYGLNLSDRSQNSSRWDALRLNNRLHNVVTFSDSLQRVDGKAKIDSYGDKGDFIFATSNLTAVNNELVKNHTRGVAIIKNSYVVIRDEITNIGKPGSMRWAMLTPAAVKIIDEKTAELTLNGEKLQMVVEGKGIKLQTWSSAPQHFYDEPNPGTILVGFNYQLKPDERVSFDVFLIPQQEANKFNRLIPPIDNWK